MTAKVPTIHASLLQENLAKGLSIVGRAVSTRSTLPVLANILLEAGADGRVKLAATNLEIMISCYVGAKVAEPFAITLPAKPLTELVNLFPAERIDVEFVRNTQTAHFTCGRNEANFKGIDASEFPLVGDIPDSGVIIKTDVLKRLVSLTAFAAATDDSKPVLAGVSVTLLDNKITMATTDGFRLSEATGELESKVKRGQRFIVPAKALVDLGKIVGDEERVVMSFPEGRQQVIFSAGSVVMASQLIDGNFPDYHPVIPKKHATRTVVSRVDALRSVKQANIFAREASNTMVFRAVPGSRVVVNATSAETGDNMATLDATVEGTEISINFNSHYFEQVLKVMDTPQVAIETTDPNAPALVTPVGQNGFRHIIMPMQFGK